jgi:hypothetical protein
MVASEQRLRDFGRRMAEAQDAAMADGLERGGGGLWLAIALHAGAHLDNVNRAPDEEVRLRILRLVVVAVAAGLAAWGLSRRGGVRQAT